MQRLKRSFTFGGRGRRRGDQKDDKDDEKNRKSTHSGHDVENGTENPDALPPKSDAEALKDAKYELDVLRKRFEDAEERYRSAHTSKRSLVKEREDLGKKLAELTEKHGEALKELDSLRADVKRLQTDVSQLDCDKEDLGEKFQRKSHAIEKELHDARESLHQFRDEKEKLEKEVKEVKKGGLACVFDEKVGQIKLHAVRKNVSEDFVTKSLKLATQGDLVDVFVSEWTGDREVAKPKDVVVFFRECQADSNDENQLKEDLQRVASLGKLALLVPLTSTDSAPLSLPSHDDALCAFYPICPESIRVDLVGGSLSEKYAEKIASACKVAYLNASLPKLLLF